MGNYRVIIGLLAAALSMGSSIASQAHNKFFRSFWHPRYLGERLDYCSLDGKECGKDVANHYCQLLGYDHATQHAIAYNIGLTNFLGTHAQCKGWRCNGFMTIACASKFAHQPPKPYHYREKQFAYPRFNDYRIDWCYDRAKKCGKRAANSFCSRMGFMQAKKFIKESAVAATKTIGSQELCFGNQCNAFKTIICYRNADTNAYCVD